MARSRFPMDQGSVLSRPRERGSQMVTLIVTTSPSWRSEDALYIPRIQKRMTITKRSPGAVLLGGLTLVLCLMAGSAHGQNPAWPQFRGPDSNPVGSNQRLP